MGLTSDKITLNKGDFVAAERVSEEGQTIVKVKLSKSGKAKFKKLNRESVGKNVPLAIKQFKSEFTLRVPIEGEKLEIGPLDKEVAVSIVEEINSK